MASLLDKFFYNVINLLIFKIMMKKNIPLVTQDEVNMLLIAADFHKIHDNRKNLIENLLLIAMTLLYVILLITVYFNPMSPVNFLTGESSSRSLIISRIVCVAILIFLYIISNLRKSYSGDAYLFLFALLLSLIILDIIFSKNAQSNIHIAPVIVSAIAKFTCAIILYTKFKIYKVVR